MRNQPFKHLGALSVLLVALTCPTTTRADLTVHSGWDLLWTQPGTQFMGDPFVGVPIWNHNFAGTIGSQYVGLTDTIVRRLANATVPGPVVPPSQSTTISVQMDAMQLASQNPISFMNGPLGTYFITLESLHGGPVSTGSMTISFDSQVNEPLTTPHGTFSSSWNIYFDVRYGTLNGPIVYSNNLPLGSTNAFWTHYPTHDALLIEDVNRFLRGDHTIYQDFFAEVAETHPFATHIVTFTIPEPTSGLLAVLGISLLGLRKYSRRFSR
jgi:hypothetical protein